MHPYIRRALRLTFVLLALFSIAVGVLDIANGPELVLEASGRVRPWIGIINIVFGLLLLGFTVPAAWWRDPET